MNDEPTTGSPPMPTIVELPSPSWASSWPIWYVSVPDRDDEPDRALRENLRRDDPDVRLARREHARAVRPDHRDPPRADVVVDAEHLVRREALGDADHGADAGVDGLVDGVGRKARGHEDQRRVRARLLDRVGDRVEDRDALDVLAALPGRDARDDLGAVVAVAQAVERPSLPVRPCTTSRVSWSTTIATTSSPLRTSDRGVSQPVLDAIGEQLADARCVVLRRLGAREPRLELDRALEHALVVDRRARQPRRSRATRPRCSSGRGSGRGAARPPRRPRRGRGCPPR